MYEPLKIDFEITESLQEAIDAFLHHINEESGKQEDCYRSEIQFFLKEAFGTLHVISREQYELLNAYYVHRGIYKLQNQTEEVAYAEKWGKLQERVRILTLLRQLQKENVEEYRTATEDIDHLGELLWLNTTTKQSVVFLGETVSKEAALETCKGLFNRYEQAFKALAEESFKDGSKKNENEPD